MYDFPIEKINLENELLVSEVKQFLSEFNLGYEKDIDYTIVMRKDRKIIATCSKAKNVLKCFAIDSEYRGEGITAKLITALIDRIFEEGIYHSFIFTKIENTKIFSSLNFKLLYTADKTALLEHGMYDVNSYIKKLIQKNNINVESKKGALVMNCNPFTNGHLYLIEEAAKKHDEVLVFIVEEDKSLFSFKHRLELVKQGVSHLKNVKVVPGGEYIISQATFPSYFLRKEDDKLKEYTKIDAGIFGKYLCKGLNITTRYVGEEPYCNVTREYNETLKEELSKLNVKVEVIKRLKYDDVPISASKVRDLIKQQKLECVKEIVPIVTWEFLNSNIGKEIMEKIKLSNSPH